MQVQYSAGAVWGTRNDVSGVGPDQLGLLQDITIDWDAQTKSLYGENQWPAVIARGQMKVTGKARFGRIFNAVAADLFFGLTAAAGSLQCAENEADTVGSSPYTVTVGNAANFVEDLGVYYAATGTRFTQVASPSAAGQYENGGTGLYTFHASDSGAGVAISYLYNNTASGKTLTISQQLMGTTPTFKLVLFGRGQTSSGTFPEVLVLNNCTASKWSIPDKIDDFQIQELDFEGFVDASGNIGKFSTME